jgi:hypothetical protein
MVKFKELKPGMFIIDSPSQRTWWSLILKKVDVMGVAMLTLSQEKDTKGFQLIAFAHSANSWDEQEAENWTIMDKRDTKIIKRKMIEAAFENSDF